MEINEIQLLKILENNCERAGSQWKWAMLNNLSPSYVSDVLSGKRGIGTSILEALGYEKEVIYRKSKT